MRAQEHKASLDTTAATTIQMMTAISVLYNIANRWVILMNAALLYFGVIQPNLITPS